MIVHIHGDGNTLNLAKDVYRLAENSQVLAAVGAAIAPVMNEEAKRIEFRQDDQPSAALDESDVKAIEASVSAGPSLTLTPTVPDPSPQTVTATLHVYSPVFDVKAPMWRFLYRNKPIYAEISDTDIARDAVKRGGSFRNDRYRVKMEVTPPKKPDGDAHYKIIQVLDFTPAEQQINMKLRPRKKPAKKRTASK